MLVVVGRLERHALVFQHLQQPGLHRGIHFADLVDEQHAAVRARHEPQLRLGNRALGEVAPRALVDRVVHAAQQRVRRLAAVPAQRRPGRLDERRVGGERRVRPRLRELEREPRDRRLPDAGRPVEDHVLRVRRRQLRDQRLDRGLLTDHFAERLRAQDVERRAREPARVERFQIVQALLRRGGLRTGLLAQRLELELAQVLLMALHHLGVDLRLDLVADGALRDQIGQLVLDLADHFLVLRLRRARLEARVLENQALQRQQAVGDRLRAHLFERAELAGAHDDLLRPQRFGQDVVQHRDLAAQLLVAAQPHGATSARRPAPRTWRRCCCRDGSRPDTSPAP